MFVFGMIVGLVIAVGAMFLGWFLSKYVKFPW